MTGQAPLASADIVNALAAGDATQQAALNRLRELVFETANGLTDIGEIEESLKWGQATFSTVRPKTGSPFRMAPLNDDSGRIALYFICTTDLVQQFRERYDDVLTFEGNRAILIDPARPLQETELAHCMAMAMRYQLGSVDKPDLEHGRRQNLSV